MYENERRKFSRDRCTFSLEQESFDLLVIGGGITGAGIARDASMRGLKVALVEAKDFGSGTSSKSSKLLHGGIRYLEKLELGLVFEASRERRLHSDLLAPNLSIPVPFIIPVYPWSPHSLPAVSAGVALYNALSLFRNHGTAYYGRDSLLAEEPSLENTGLKGGVAYYDVVMDDARLVLENVRSAVEYGATAVNYMAVRGFEKDSNGNVRGVWVRDVSPLAKKLADQNLGRGADVLVRAKAFVNATGPWSDYIRRLDSPASKPILRPTKGAHLVIPNEKLGVHHAFVLTAKKDNRVFFTIPWYGRTLVGTTDTDYDPRTDGDLNSLKVNANEVDYLLEGVKRAFPGANVGPDDVHSSFAGVRPLVADPKAASESSVSREHKIFKEDSGLYTIAGGKYTTYRTMAKEMVDLVVRDLAKKFREFGSSRLKQSSTDLHAIIPPEASGSDDEGTHRMGVLEEYGSLLGESTVAHLQGRYGSRWKDVARLAVGDKALAERIVPSEPDILCEAAYARSDEMAISIEDFFRRRTMLALKAPLEQHLDRVELVAKVLFGKDSEWSPTREEVNGWQGLGFRTEKK